MDLARIVITRQMGEDGELFVTITSDPEDLDLVEALGMIVLGTSALLARED